MINENQEKRIFFWLKNIVLKNVRPIGEKVHKIYKGIDNNELLPFRYAFNISGIEYRVILVKVKNSIYIEFHLGKHKYYDFLSKDLGLR